jgi:hypothetical protein
MVLGMIAAGCGAGDPNDSATTSPTPSPATTSPTGATQEQALAIYWVGDTARGLRLFREFRRLTVEPGPTGAITAALTSLFEGRPDDPDYTSLWPSGTRLLAVRTEGEAATVDLSLPQPSWGSEAEQRAIDQLVWTVTAADNEIRDVRLLIDGSQVESLAGHVDASGAFQRDETFRVLAPIWITSPAEGDEVAQPLTIEGMASTFEANVVWEVLRGGTVVASGFTTAREAAPAWAPWSVTVPSLPAGEYVVRASESSAEDGSLVVEDTKRIVLR